MLENKNLEVPYSILELATVGANVEINEVFNSCLQLAQKAEEFGYSRFWLAEHHNMVSIASSATAVLIAYIAGGTKKIRVGSGGIMLPNHAPLLVAEQFGTLGHLFPGRIDLGLGRAPGTDQVTARAIRADRMQSVYQFPEEIGEIQKYFSNENKQAKVRAAVAEGVDIPLYILGSSTDSAHLAAQKGLPYVFASHFAPSQLFEALAIYRKNFQPSGVLSKPYAMACINVIAADTEEEAENMSTSMLRLLLGVISGQIDYLQKPTKMTPELREISRSPAIQSMLKYTFVGNKETVRKKTAAFLKNTGVNELIVVSHIYDAKDRIKSFKLFSQVMNEGLNTVTTTN